MSDVAIARTLITEIAGDCWNGKADMLHRVHKACRAHGKKFTERRLRAFWHREAAGVRYHEMLDLAEVAMAEKEAAERLEHARASHAQYIAQTASLVALLQAADADFHGDQIAALGGVIGGMDRAGTQGRGQ